MYFGENNNSNVLKSLNIAHVITKTLYLLFVVSMLNFTRYFHKKRVTTRMVLLCHKIHPKSPDKYQNYSLMFSIVDFSK